jgi:RimJ/RimL family protein N-acetyltransferase
MDSSLDVQLLTPADWEVLRSVRLKALRDAPYAFMSSYEREERRDEHAWRQQFEHTTWIVARQAGRAIGLMSSLAEPTPSDSRHLESIWVDPEHRRCGVFRSLLKLMCDLARRDGVTRFMVWVLEDNHVAWRVYEKVGFEATGERQFLPNIGRFELRLSLSLQP